MVVEGDQAPTQEDARDLFRSREGAKALQQDRTARKASLRRQMGDLKPAGTWGEFFSPTPEPKEPKPEGGVNLKLDPYQQAVMEGRSDQGPYGGYLPGRPGYEEHVEEAREHSLPAALEKLTALAGKAAVKVADIPTDIANIGKPPELRTPTLEEQSANWRQIPHIEGTDAVTGALNVAIDQINQLVPPFAKPETGLALPLISGEAPAAVFGSTMISHLPEEVVNAITTLQDPNASKEEKVRAVGNPVAASFMAGLMMKHGTAETLRGPSTEIQGPPATGESLRMPEGAEPPPPPKPLAGEQRELPLDAAVDRTKNNGAPATAEALKDQQQKGEQHAERIRSDKEKPAEPGQEPEGGEADRRRDVQQTTPREGEGTAPQETAVDTERAEGEQIAEEGGEPEKIISSAVRKASGDVEYGANHPDILNRLGIPGFKERESRNTPDFGFRTNKRPFVSRQEGARVANRSGQSLQGPLPEGHQMHSDEVAHPDQPGKALGSVAQPALAPALDPFEQFLDKAIHATDPLRGGRTLEGVTSAPIWMTKSLANGALRATRVAYRTAKPLAKDAVKHIAKAIEVGVEWARKQGHPNFNADDVRAWIDSVLPASQKRDIDRLRIGTSKPSVKKPTMDPVRDQPEINLQAVIDSKPHSAKDPHMLDIAQGLIKQFYPEIKLGATPLETAHNFIRHAADNLKWLYYKMQPELRARARLWYEGARTIAIKWSNAYGISREGVAGVIAVLSPGRDWFQNLELARRVLTVVTKPPNGGRMTPEMEKTVQAYTKLKEFSDDAKARCKAALPVLKRKTWKDLDLNQKAIWLRAWSDTHGPYGFNRWAPEGHELGPKMNDDGVTPAKITMTSFNNLMVAIDTAENPTLDNISDKLGYGHKVRNFYNNIINPNNAKFWDVTSDTHQVCASLLRPLGQKSIQVSHNFGNGVKGESEGPGSVGATGVNGAFYAFHADAARLAAREIAQEVPDEKDLLGRAMQSITWEAVRSLFPDVSKTEELDKLVNDIWDKYSKGQLTADEARDQIFNLKTYGKEGQLLKPGGIQPPDWVERGREATPEGGQTDQPEELPGRGGTEGGRPDTGGTRELPAKSQGGIRPQIRDRQSADVGKVEALLNKAIEATRPGTAWTGRTAFGIGQLPVWLAQEAAHGALRAVRAAWRTGGDIAKAIEAGVKWLRDQKHPQFNEDEARTWLTGALQPQGPVNPEQTYGVAARVSAQAAAEGVIPPITPGTGVDAETAIRQGQMDLKAGADPQKIADNFKATGRQSARDLGVVRAHGENLRRTARDIGEEDGYDSPLYLAAKQADFDWQQNVVQPMRTSWHEQGQVQQGETAIDTGSFHGLNRAYFDETGHDIPQTKQPQADKVAKENKKAQDETQEARTKFTGHLTDTLSMVEAERKAQEAVWKTVRDWAARRAELENKARVAESQREKEVYNVQAEAARKAQDAAWKTVRDAAAQNVKDENARRILEAQRKNEIFQIQEEAARKAMDAAAQQARDAATKAAEAERKARSADADRDRDLRQIEERRKQKVKEATDKVTRDAATRQADAEKKERIDRAKREKELAKIEAQRQRKVADAVARRHREMAAEAAKRAREMQANPDVRVWQRAKVYLDRGLDNFDEIRSKVATDLGMPIDQVTHWLAYDKRTKFLADDVWRKQQRERLLKNQAKRFLTELQVPGWQKALGKVPRTMFSLKVGFHGTVALGTHAPMVAFQPKWWGTYFHNFGKMYRMVGTPDPIGQAAGKAYYERQVQDLMQRKNYTTAQRAGLVNDPFHYEDFNSPETSSYWKSFTEMGNRGYTVLKLLRQDMFDQMWDQLPKTSQIPEVAEALADGINHSTGVVKSLPGSRHLAKVFFAPKLEASRAAWLVGDTARAGGAMLNWKNADLGEKTFAMNYLKERLWIAGTFATMLAANQGFLMATGSNQQVNLTDPFKSDWLKFKVAGMNVTYGNPMITLMRLPVRVGMAIANNRGKFSKIIYPDESVYKIMGDYVRSQMSPFAGVSSDLLFGSDYQQRPLPRALFGTIPGPENMPKRLRAQGVQPYGWGEYFLETGSMIPVEEVVRDVFGRGMGMPPDQQKSVFNTVVLSTLKAAAMAGTGTRITEDFEAKQKADLQAVQAETGAAY